jgi:hypothetical protein
MDSRSGIGGMPSKRITRSWYPGGRECPRSPTSRGTSNLGTDVGYWGRVDSRGEFEDDSGFLEPTTPSRIPWRPLFVAVRRIVPLVVAALVGAVTALAWQSFVIRPAPVVSPALAVPAAQSVVPAQAIPAPAPAVPVPAPPTLLGSAPASSSAVERSPSAVANDHPPLLGKPRTAAVKVDRVRAAKRAVPRAQDSDPDAILQPTLM